MMASATEKNCHMSMTQSVSDLHKPQIHIIKHFIVVILKLNPQ